MHRTPQPRDVNAEQVFYVVRNETYCQAPSCYSLPSQL